jgi:hypothetical protein
MSTKQITVWSVWDNKMTHLSFNHISDGYDDETLEPNPVSDEQRIAWKGKAWVPISALLVDGVVVMEKAND